MYGFLGPNGAGKSTAMKMLLGLIRPTGGDFVIDGKHYPQDRMEILQMTGSFIETPAFYGNLTGEENLCLNHGRLLFEGSLEELRNHAQTKGYSANHLEDTFLSLIEEDNRKGGRD